MRQVDVNLSDAAGVVLRRLPRGAFLTVAYGHRVNTMTIGWGMVGVVWTGPVFTVAVRTSRHTFRLIERAPDFTVSVPLDDSYQSALAYCGTHSGKDVDKFRETGLTPRPGVCVQSPVVGIPGLHFECRTLLRTPMDPTLMHPDLAEFYPQHDYHTLYYGRVEACYRLEIPEEEEGGE